MITHEKVTIAMLLLTSDVCSLTIAQCKSIGISKHSFTTNKFGTYPPPVEVQRSYCRSMVVSAIMGDYSDDYIELSHGGK
jgi:hypothetical protein